MIDLIIYGSFRDEQSRYGNRYAKRHQSILYIRVCMYMPGKKRLANPTVVGLCNYYIQLMLSLFYFCLVFVARISGLGCCVGIPIRSILLSQQLARRRTFKPLTVFFFNLRGDFLVQPHQNQGLLSLLSSIYQVVQQIIGLNCRHFYIPSYLLSSQQQAVNQSCKWNCLDNCF